MKNLIQNPTFLMVTSGLLAFAIARHYYKKNQEKPSPKQEEKSNIGGCGCGA